MEIKEYQERLKQLEESISMQLLEFKRDTGVNVKEIDVHYEDVTCIGREPIFVFNGVSARTDIED